MNFYKKFNLRTLVTFILIISLFTVSVFRIYFINEDINKKTVDKSYNTITFNYGSTRGNIYDCNGRLITGCNINNYALISPNTKTMMILKKYFKGKELNDIAEKLRKNKPILIKTKEVINDIGIYGFSSAERYTENTLCKHLLGYLNNKNEGISGIEKGFNDILYSNSEKTVSVPINANGEALYYDKPEFKGEQNGNSVTLTIDKNIQKISENVMRNINTGALMVSEIKTGKIKALVSKPDFNQNSIAESLNNADSPLINRCLSAYNAGSVFKPLVAAVATEESKSNFLYKCKGSCIIDGYSFNCHKLNGHGDMDLAKALEQSCNTYFYNLAQTLNLEDLVNYASKMSFGGEIDLGGNIIAKPGNLTKLSYLQKSKRAVANFAIGQGDLLVSPAAMINLYSAISNNGEFISPTVIEKTTVDGKERKTGNKKSVKVFNKKTADTIKNYLKNVIEQGTGKNAKPNNCTAAGKTATAETGWVKNGKKAVHAWFCGFFPFEEPKYAAVIFAENANSGGGDCAPVFKALADGIYNIDTNTK